MEIVKRDLILHNYTTRCYGILLGRASYLGFGPVAACLGIGFIGSWHNKNTATSSYVDFCLQMGLQGLLTWRSLVQLLNIVVSISMGKKWSGVKLRLTLTLGPKSPQCMESSSSEWEGFGGVFGRMKAMVGGVHLVPSMEGYERCEGRYPHTKHARLRHRWKKQQKRHSSSKTQRFGMLWNVGSFRWESAGVF